MLFYICFAISTSSRRENFTLSLYRPTHPDKQFCFAFFALFANKIYKWALNQNVYYVRAHKRFIFSLEYWSKVIWFLYLFVLFWVIVGKTEKGGKQCYYLYIYVRDFVPDFDTHRESFVLCVMVPQGAVKDCDCLKLKFVFSLFFGFLPIQLLSRCLFALSLSNGHGWRQY